VGRWTYKILVEVASLYEDLQEKYGDNWDVVVSTEVIEHLFDPRKFMSNIYNILREEGWLIITTPYHGYLKNLSLAITGKLDNHYTALWDGGHIKFWSKRTLTQLLSEAGFDEITFYGAGRLPWFWKSMVMCARKNTVMNNARDKA
jgi:2-polyprenyl-6-hydroxyphenyl methylase/3-demethylubiquinone-9 3-methyltransferase